MRRLLAATAAAALVTLLGVAGVAAAAPTDEQAAAATRGTGWLVTQLEAGALTNFGQPDWGLTIDALLALRATGTSSEAASTITASVAGHVRSFNSYDDFGIPDVRDAGATAKLLVAAVSTDSDPTDFGGYDLRAETLALVEAGRVRDRITPELGGDQSNTFDQAFAVVGLARSGGVPDDVVGFLLTQQCAAGGFRLYPDASPSCDSEAGATLDVDTTAMAVQALLVAGRTEVALKGATWLAGQQQADGSFGGSGPTAGTNANSTGLAAQALAATGLDAAAGRAADWLLGRQWATGADTGAVAYDQAAFDTATAAGALDELGRDQWRRATAQAVLGLAGVPLGLIGTTPPLSTSPSPSSSASASGSPSPGQPSPPGSPSPGSPSGPPVLPGDPVPTDSSPPVATSAPALLSDSPVPVAANGRLPRTGTPLLKLVGVAAGLLVLGVGCLLITRHRRSA